MVVFIGRDGGIRTHDPLTPSQVRYQAALHPDAVNFGLRVQASGSGLRDGSSLVSNL